MFIVNSKQMKEAEQNCVRRLSIEMYDLMERAGTACADCIVSEYRPSDVSVLCGNGNNGGDGFVIARRLAENGFKVSVVLCCGEPSTDDSKAMYGLLDEGIFIYPYDCAPIDNSDIIVDCIFGTGFSGKIREPLASFINTVNTCKADIIAVDVPSGADCDSCLLSTAHIEADKTFAIAGQKMIHIRKPFCSVCGNVKIVDIGINDEDFAASGAGVPESISGCDELKRILPERPVDSHKGTFGHVLNIAGSMRMQGAAILAAKGALRCGAGLVTVAVPDKAYIPVASKLTESLILPLPSDSDGFFARSDLPEILKAMSKASAVLCGCGLGVTNATKEIVYKVVEDSEVPVLIDADGINALSENTEILKKAKAPVIVTPHPGEMSRLTKLTVGEITADPQKAACDFSREYNVTVVLKGANTVIASPDGRVYINATGNNALSRGGSGDLLAGMIASFLAQGCNPFNAAIAGVYLHGLAADIAVRKFPARFLLPGDIADKMPSLFRELGI